MSFVDIVRDLVPEAVAHIEALRGRQDPDSSSAKGGEAT
jgi:hypothetical protein